MVLARRYFRSPEIVPIARRKMNILCVDFFRDDGRNEEIPAEQKRVIVAVVILSSGVLEKDWLHQRHAGARGVFHRRVDVWQKFVSELDVALADRFLIGPASPGLVIGSALGGVIAINRIENS